MGATFFVSDVHFRDAANPEDQRFLQFLHSIHGEAEALYLVGDIFDFWIGHKAVLNNYEPLLTALQKLQSSGTRVVYFTGNHDPAPISRLIDMDIPIHSRGTAIELGQHKIWLEHGDQLYGERPLNRLACTLARHQVIQQIARQVPLRTAWSLAQRYTAVENSYDRPLSRYLRDEWFEQKINSGFNTVIIGHYHRAVFHSRRVRNQEYALIVLGDWEQQFTFAKYDDGFALYRFSGVKAKPQKLPFGDHAPVRHQNT